MDDLDRRLVQVLPERARLCLASPPAASTWHSTRNRRTARSAPCPGPSCPAGLADHAPHHSRSASGGGRAGNSIGASADSPIARSTGSIDRGAVITASNRREPSQCAHMSTSIANTRRIGDAHAGALKRRDGVRRARTVQNCSGVPNTRICRQHQGLADGPSARAQ
jgi:hypothetical protein